MCTDWFVWTLICVHCLVCVDTCSCALSGLCGHTFVCTVWFLWTHICVQTVFPTSVPPLPPPTPPLHSLPHPPPHQILTEQTFHWPYSHRNSGGCTILAHGFLQPTAGSSRLNTFDQAITVCTIILFFTCGETTEQLNSSVKSHHTDRKSSMDEQYSLLL